MLAEVDSSNALLWAAPSLSGVSSIGYAQSYIDEKISVQMQKCNLRDRFWIQFRPDSKYFLCDFAAQRYYFWLDTISSSSLRQAGSTIQRNFKSVVPEFVMHCLAMGGM